MSKVECRNETMKVLFIFVLWVVMAWSIVGILKWGEWICQ